MTEQVSQEMRKGPGRALFFGRDGCALTERAIAHLRKLRFDVSPVLSKSRHEPIPSEVQGWSGEYILCFRSYFFLRKPLLERASVAAINFHPGPVEYPGSGCLNWALYEGSSHYGATAHLMNEQIDNGAILECRRFPLTSEDNVASALPRTHQLTYELLVDTTAGLAREGQAYLERQLVAAASEQWRGLARKMVEIERLQQIEPTCTREELERIIRATYTPDFPPEIRLHGYRFVLQIEE